MNKFATLALGGVQMLALAAAVHATDINDDGWSEWRTTTLHELKQEVVDDQIVEETRIQLNDLEIITKRVKPENGEDEGTIEFSFTDDSEDAPVVEIPEGATYEEFLATLQEAYPGLEKQITEFENFEESDFSKDFDKKWEELNEKAQDNFENMGRPTVEIPEDATPEERREILIEAYPELKDRFEEMDAKQAEWEKQREEFKAEFDKEWEDAKWDDVEPSKGTELIPEDATPEEAREIFLKEHPEYEDFFKDWDKPSREEPETEKPAVEQPDD